MGKGVIYCVVLVAICCLTLGSLSEGKHGKQIPSAFIIGTVCKSSNFVSGDSVAVECGDGISSFRKEAKTDKHGDFKIPMPASAIKHFKSFKACSVKLMSTSGEHGCAVASTVATTLVHLNSRKNKGSTRIFSAGLLKLSPLNHSNRCNKKRNLRANADEEVTTMKNTISHAEQTQEFLPQFLPFTPELTPSTIHQLPQRPALPSLPEHQVPNVNDQKIVPFFPFPPNPLQPPLLPPNPLLPPPSIFPPVPGLTPPPSGILPPVPGLTPPPSGILPPVPGLTPPPSGILPPIPGLTPPPPPASIFPPIPGIPTIPGVPNIPGIPALASPPPPPPPSLLPPFPFPPGFPGIPPAASKSSVKP